MISLFDAAYNTTAWSGSTSTIATFGDFPVIIVLALVAGFAVAAFSLPWFKRFAVFFSFAGKSLVFALKGAGVCAGVGAIYLTFDWLGRGVSSIEPIYYAYALGGFALLASIGYVADVAWVKIKKNYARLNKNG